MAYCIGIQEIDWHHLKEPMKLSNIHFSEVSTGLLLGAWLESLPLLVQLVEQTILIGKYFYNHYYDFIL